MTTGHPGSCGLVSPQVVRNMRAAGLSKRMMAQIAQVSPETMTVHLRRLGIPFPHGGSMYRSGVHPVGSIRWKLWPPRPRKRA